MCKLTHNAYQQYLREPKARARKVEVFVQILQKMNNDTIKLFSAYSCRASRITCTRKENFRARLFTTRRSDIRERPRSERERFDAFRCEFCKKRCNFHAKVWFTVYLGILHNRPFMNECFSCTVSHKVKTILASAEGASERNSRFMYVYFTEIE